MYLPIYLSIYLSIHLSIYLSTDPSVCKFEKEASLRDFMKLITSKTKQFRETSSIFDIDNIKNKAILRGFLQKWKVTAELMASYQCVLFFFPLSTIFRLLRKSDAKSYEVLRLKNHLSKPDNLMLQNATSLRKSGPWPPNISDEHVFCTARATRHASLQILFKCPTPANVFETATKLSRLCALLRRCRILCASHMKRCFNIQKVLREWCVLYILTSKCDSRHTGAHFFDISTSKSAPKMMCFYTLTWKCGSRRNFFDIPTSKRVLSLKCLVHFDLQMCFASQRRAIFHFSSGQMAPHPPLWRAYFSTLRSHKSLKRTRWFAPFLPLRAPASSFCWLSLLWSSFFFSSLRWFSHLCFSIRIYALYLVVYLVNWETWWILCFLGISWAFQGELP